MAKSKNNIEAPPWSIPVFLIMLFIFLVNVYYDRMKANDISASGGYDVFLYAFILKKHHKASCSMKVSYFYNGKEFIEWDNNVDKYIYDKYQVGDSIPIKISAIANDWFIINGSKDR